MSDKVYEYCYRCGGTSCSIWTCYDSCYNCNRLYRDCTCKCKCGKLILFCDCMDITSSEIFYEFSPFPKKGVDISPEIFDEFSPFPEKEVDTFDPLSGKSKGGKVCYVKTDEDGYIISEKISKIKLKKISNKTTFCVQRGRCVSSDNKYGRKANHPLFSREKKTHRQQKKRDLIDL